MHPERSVVAAPRSSNPDHILRSLHWLKVYRNALKTSYFHQDHHIYAFPVIFSTLSAHFITVQPSRSTGSSTLVTLLKPPVHSSFKITNLCCSSLWNNLPPTLRVPYQSAVSSSPSSSSSSGSDPWPVCWHFWWRFPSVSEKELYIRTYISANNTDDIRTYKSADIVQRYPHLRNREQIWRYSHLYVSANIVGCVM